MSYSCYLGGVQWPTPSKLQVKIKGKNKTLVLLNEGEVNFLRFPGLTEITVPFDLPMLTGSNSPDYYLSVLELLKTSKQTTQFILVRRAPSGGALYDTNIKVSVEDYNITEDAKSGLDVTVDVNLKQWRDYGTKTATVEQPQTAGGTGYRGRREGAGGKYRPDSQDLHGQGRGLSVGHRGQVLR